uniref:cyclin-D3-2-like n=1 Tax=Erigeron canadensis TaxID=72917 RepID=UPI001CB8E346|nr:cyclin-D3-2-like [Erigeron canadensis]
MMMNNNTTFAFLEDGLFCDEQEQDLDLDFDDEKIDTNHQILANSTTFLENDLVWEEDELITLLSKQENVGLFLGKWGLISDLSVSRKESVDWMIRVSNHFGFVPMTTILSVNYFDRFLLTPHFQNENKPWMNQLVAVACLSLASKVEEIQPPLLMDLQVEGSKFVFESKTIMKMELLVLSSLEWKMNPVTMVSFFDYISRRLGLITHYQHSEIVRRCERIFLVVINDSRFLAYLPSVMAVATMLLVIKEVDPENAYDYQNQLKGFLQINEEKVDDCTKFILEVSDNHGTSYFIAQKRKYDRAPGSPNGVIDSYFSSDNSSDSWAVASSVSSSPERPVLKKIRAQEQQMRLGPMSHVSVITLNNSS